MRLDNDDTAELEWERFKQNIIAANPWDASKILKVIEQPHASLAQPLSDDQMDTYQPLSGQEISETVKMLREFGLSLE